MKPSVKPTTIDQYIAALEEPAVSRLRELRALAQEAVPDAAEAIRWGNPVYLHPSGTILFALSAYRDHTNFTLTPSTREAFTEELDEYETGKGSVKLPYTGSVPTDLLRRMIAFRVREHEEDGVMWM